MVHSHYAQPPTGAPAPAPFPRLHAGCGLTMRILIVTSAAYTGADPDPAGAFPAPLARALQSLGHQVAVLAPAYRTALAAARPLGLRAIAQAQIGGQRVQLHETRLPRSRNRLWLLDCPALFDRAGGACGDAPGLPWPDDGERFMLLARAAELLAGDAFGLRWRPSVVQAHDWPCAPVMLLLHAKQPRPALVFSIHATAETGLLADEDCARLQVPAGYGNPEAPEHEGGCSFFEAGIRFADRITLPAFPGPASASGDDPLGTMLHARSQGLRIIVPAIDTRAWNPATDAALAALYSPTRLRRKQLNKLALQAECGLETGGEGPLIAVRGPFGEGALADALARVLKDPVCGGIQLLLLDEGDTSLPAQFAALVGGVAARCAHRSRPDETLRHRILAGADVLLLPTPGAAATIEALRALRYATIPALYPAPGLEDIIVDVTADTLGAGTATGFRIAPGAAGELPASIRRICRFYKVPQTWRHLQIAAMRTEIGWHAHARRQETVCTEALAERAERDPGD